MRSPVDQRGYSLLVHEPKGILPFGPDQRGCSPSPRPRSRELPTGMTRIEQLWPKHGSRSAATLERPRRGMLSMAPCFGRPSHAPKSRACHRHRKCVTFSETRTAPQEASCVLPAETSKYINDRINGVTHFRPRAEEAGATYGARPLAGRTVPGTARASHGLVEGVRLASRHRPCPPSRRRRGIVSATRCRINVATLSRREGGDQASTLAYSWAKCTQIRTFAASFRSQSSHSAHSSANCTQIRAYRTSRWSTSWRAMVEWRWIRAIEGNSHGEPVGQDEGVHAR
jgi:hypothetical protein